jgi:Flp pilus assembly protein TadG
MKKGIITRKLFHLARDERGSEMVEFAVSALVLMLFLIGIFQSLLAVYAYHFTTYAAHRAVRFAMVRGHTWSQSIATTCSTSAPPQFSTPYDCTASATDIQNYVRSLVTPGINRDNVSVNTTSSYVWPGTTPSGATTPCTSYANSQGCMVRVKVSYSVNVLPFIKGTTLTMGATSEKVIMQ